MGETGLTDQAPLFNVKAVVQQTGLKPDTLRAWERRHGLPTPARSGGGQRLYTQRDIETLRWLVARQLEGLTIARAVDHWRRIESEGRDPLQALAPVPPRAGSAVEYYPAGSTLDQLRKEWLSACLAYDRDRADQAAAQAFALYPLETVCTELLQWALHEVGELWQQGTATVQQEHFATELVIRRLESLLAAAPTATRPGRVLAACPPQERHTVGLLLLTLLLRRRGWAVVYLGADVPAAKLDATVATIQPDLIILAAQRLPSAAALLEIAQSLHGRVPIGFAGGAFNSLPAIRSRIPGFFLGESVDTALSVVDSLLSTPRAAPPAEPLPVESGLALEHFRRRRVSIEAELVEAAATNGFPSWQIADASAELARHMEAALALGDVSLLDAGLAHLEHALNLSTLGEDALPGFLHAYSQVAKEQLDERAEPIFAWLRRHARG